MNEGEWSTKCDLSSLASHLSETSLTASLWPYTHHSNGHTLRALFLPVKWHKSSECLFKNLWSCWQTLSGKINSCGSSSRKWKHSLLFCSMHWQALLRPSTLITDRLFDFVQTNTAISCRIEEHVSEIFTVDMFQHRSNRQKWNVLESFRCYFRSFINHQASSQWQKALYRCFVRK